MAYTEFYVTKGASTSDVNGGGPNLGTDDAPVATKANCSSDIAGTVITNDDADGWTGASVGDWLCFDSAGTKDFARITDITGDVLTVTPAVTGAAAGKNVNVGGAWATVDHAASTVTTAFVNAADDFPRVNIKEGTYAESVDFDNSGTLPIPLTFEGYETAAGDNPAVADMPLIDANGTADHALDGKTGSRSYLILRNVRARTDQADKCAINMYRNCHVGRCKATSSGVGAAGHGIYVDYYCDVLDCWVDDAGGAGIYILATGMVCGCLVQGTTGIGIYVRGYVSAVCNIIDSPADDCIQCSADCSIIMGNIGYGSTAGSGLRFADLAGELQPIVLNNIFVNNNQYGIEVDAADKYLLHEDYNAFYNNGVAARLNVLEDGDNDVTLTADPFVNAAGGDFRINIAAAGGALVRAAGFPGTLLDGTNIGYACIGPLQPPASRWARPYRGN